MHWSIRCQISALLFSERLHFTYEMLGSNTYGISLLWNPWIRTQHFHFSKARWESSQPLGRPQPSQPPMHQGRGSESLYAASALLRVGLSVWVESLFLTHTVFACTSTLAKLCMSLLLEILTSYRNKVSIFQLISPAWFSKGSVETLYYTTKTMQIELCHTLPLTESSQLSKAFEERSREMMTVRTQCVWTIDHRVADRHPFLLRQR